MLIELFRVYDAAELVRVSDFVHDWKFNVEMVRFERRSSILEIGFEREMFEERTEGRGWIIKEIAVPIRQCSLHIHHAISFSIEDTQHIGEYPFDTVEYDRDTGTLSINSSIPMDFRIQIERIEVSVWKNKEVSRLRNYWMLNI